MKIKGLFFSTILCIGFFTACNITPQEKAEKAVSQYLKNEVTIVKKPFSKSNNELPTNPLNFGDKSSYNTIKFETITPYTFTKYEMQYHNDKKMQELLDDSVRLNLAFSNYEYLCKQHADNKEFISNITPIKDSLHLIVAASRKYIFSKANLYIGKEIYKIKHHFDAQFVGKDIYNYSGIFYLNKEFEVLGWDKE